MQIEDPVALLDSLRGLPRETDWVEFKANRFNAESIGKYVSALANSAMFHEKDHAYLVFGVEDGTHDVIGTDIDLAGKTVGGEPFLFWLAKLLDPKLAVRHVPFDYEGKRVEILCVDPAYQRPVKFQQIPYIRVESCMQPLANYSERERALWQITSRYTFETTAILAHVTEPEIGDKFDYSRLLKMLGKTLASKPLALEYLTDLQLIKSNMQGRYDVAALLGLACAENMNQFALLRGKAPRVIVYRDSSKLDADEDTEGSRGYATSFESLMKYVMGRIPHDEVMRHGIRTTVHKIPEPTVREFVANAIIHQDFTESGGRPIIEIYTDKVRIINPGIPLVDPERFIDTPSKTRNPMFAELMRNAGLCERRGSGVDRALMEIEKESLPPPYIQTVEGSTSVTVFMFRRFAELSADERVRACYQHACLRYERSDYMSNGSLRARFGLKQGQYPQVSNVIRDAIDAGKIRPLADDQPNRNARYVPYWA